MKIKGMAATFDSPNVLVPVEIEITDPKIIAMIERGTINEYSITTCDPEDEIDDEPEKTITNELSSLLNSYCAENVSGTPDFILAKYMIECLKSFNEAVSHRAQWRGEPVELPSLARLRDKPREDI